MDYAWQWNVYLEELIHGLASPAVPRAGTACKEKKVCDDLTWSSQSERELAGPLAIRTRMHAIRTAQWHTVG